MNAPDVNKRREVSDAIFNMPVVGGYSRSYSMDADGEMEPGRYIEKLGDFVTKLSVERAVNAMFDNDFIINGEIGTITAMSLERLVVTTAKGDELVFERTQ